MDESRRPVRRRRPVWRPLFPRIGLSLRDDRPVRHVHRPSDYVLHRLERIPWPRLLPEGSSSTREDSPEVHSSERSRSKLLSVDDLNPTEASATDTNYGGNSDEAGTGEGTSGNHGNWSDDDSDTDEDCPFGDPFLEDRFGNLTEWRLSDLKKKFVEHVKDESSKPMALKKKVSKAEKLDLYNDRMKQYMKSALNKYNNEEKFSEDSYFEFVKATKESSIIEGDMLYQHFNFAAIQNQSTICLFFAEVIPDGENCDVTSCKLLKRNDNGKCLGCTNQGDPSLRHPAGVNDFAGGHKDCKFPFLSDTDSEDDSD